MDTLVDELSQRLARRIRLERDGRGWSLADLAERSGVSKATISKIERAEVSPTAVVLVRLASAFDLTLAGLMLRAEGQGERLSLGRIHVRLCGRRGTPGHPSVGERERLPLGRVRV